MFFKALNETNVLIRQRGGFRIAPLFERAGRVYAKMGSNFHELTANKGVSGTNTEWVEFDGAEADKIAVSNLFVEYKAVASNVTPLRSVA